MLNSLIIVESSFLKDIQNVLKSLYHESMRTYFDKIIVKEDQDWFIKTLHELTKKHFDS